MHFKFFTYNVDFGVSTAKETASLRSIRDKMDVGCIQEAKHLRVKSALGDAFGVHQNLRKESKQGVAVVWRKSRVKRFAPTTANKRPLVRRAAGYVLGVDNLGLRMLPRFINYRLLNFNGITICVVSTHRPPQRYRRLWSLFDKALIRFVKAMPFPIIVGMDSNEHTHALFAKNSGMIWHGIGIDGFWLDRELEKYFVKGSLQRHPKFHSDHHPVSIVLDI